MIPRRSSSSCRRLLGRGLLPVCVAGMLGCGPKPSTQTPQARASAAIADEAQAEPTEPAALELDGLRMLGVLEALASDDLGGRYTLHDDIRRAAELITARYREAGVAGAGQDGYLRDFEVAVGVDPGPGMSLGITRGKKVTEIERAAFVPRPEGAAGHVDGPLVFVGYGLERAGDEDEAFDELAGLPLQGAVALVLAGAPRPAKETSAPQRRFGRADRSLMRKLERLAAAGASAVIVVDDAATALPEPTVDAPLRRRVEIPVVQLDAATAFRQLRELEGLKTAIDRSMRPHSKVLAKRMVHLSNDAQTRTRAVPNVLAVVPGTDLAQEIVLVGAHYDHLGTDAPGHGRCHLRRDDEGTEDRVCNGADDNASGSAIVAELAMAFTAGPAPRRTLVFVHFAGEEMGLLGSRALAAQLDEIPPFQERRVVAMLNVDMVGRLRERLTVSGVGSSPAWMEMLDERGPGPMRVLYDKSLTTRSDHAPFYERGIPSLFFFTELHDDYHSPGDEIDGIVRDGVVEVGRLVGDLTQMLAEGREVPFAAPARPEEGLVRALPGEDPSTIVKEAGPEAPTP